MTELSGLRPHKNTLGKIALAILFLLLLQVGAVYLWAKPAQAASMGPGMEYGDIGHIGSYRLADGTLAYCLEIGVYEPWGAQSHSEVVSTLPAFSSKVDAGWMFGFSGQLHVPELTNPETIRQMNYVIQKWGQTSNNRQAAAVALAVFQLRGDSQNFTNLMVQGIRDRGYGSDVDLSLQMIAEAQQNAVAPVAPAAVAAPVLTLDEHGEGTLKYFAGTTKLVLSNAVFVDTAQNEKTLGGAVGGTVAIKGLKPAGWDSEYEVSVTAHTESGREGWPAQLVLHHPSVQNEQRIAVATGLSTGTVQKKTATATASVTNVWWPKISTRVSARIVEHGQRFADVVTVTEHEDGGHWSIAGDGKPMPLKAIGTLYGPLEGDPSVDPQSEAPQGTPIADVVELEIDSGSGEYAIESNVRAEQTGYYTWVWRLEWDQQTEAVRNPQRTGVSALNTEKFPVQDRFGEATETHVHFQRLTMVTRLKEDVIGRGWSITDEVGVTKEKYGGWIKDPQGDIIPVTLRGTLYHSVQEPQVSDFAPVDAEAISTTLVTLQGPGIIDSEPVTIPAQLEGFVTMQWCIFDEDQPESYRELTRESCDEYGLPGETAKIESPQVTTQAQPHAVVGDDIIDVAEVTGLIPNESFIDFVAYLMPEVDAQVYDENWNAQEEVWTAEMIEELGAETCTAQPVAVTPTQSVESAGTYTSPAVNALSSGTVHWVERLFATDAITGEAVLVAEGECGLANETTLIVEPVIEEPAVEETEVEEVKVAAFALPATGSTSIILWLLTAVGLGFVTTGVTMMWRRK